MKICLVCSQGGHMTEMLQLIDAFSGHDVFMVTQGNKATKSSLTQAPVRGYVLTDFLDSSSFRFWRNLFSMAALSLQELKVLMKERPDLIVTTGSEIALPVCYMGKIMRKKVVFVETLTRICDLSMTGKLIYPIADLFLVQWEHLCRRHEKAKYWGKII